MHSENPILAYSPHLSHYSAILHWPRFYLDIELGIIDNNTVDIAAKQGTQSKNKNQK